jgi:hypothetical protein
VLDDFEARMEARDLIRKGFARLDPREQEIVTAVTLHGVPNRILSAEFNISRGRVNQITDKALRKIRTHLVAKHHVAFNEPYWQKGKYFLPHYYLQAEREAWDQQRRALAAKFNGDARRSPEVDLVNVEAINARIVELVQHIPQAPGPDPAFEPTPLDLGNTFILK